jgi:hypothetical protein
MMDSSRRRTFRTAASEAFQAEGIRIFFRGLGTSYLAGVLFGLSFK